MTFFPSRLLRCLAVLAALTWTTKAHPITNAAPTPVRLPAPLNATFPVGSQVFKLVDNNRTDPYNATEKRAVEITVYYPSAGQNDGTCSNGTNLAPYMPAAMASLIDQNLGIPSGAMESVFTDTCLGAPSISSAQRNLIVMSTGLGSCLYIIIYISYLSLIFLPSLLRIYSPHIPNIHYRSCGARLRRYQHRSPLRRRSRRVSRRQTGLGSTNEPV
ncbi:hypothetical protein FRB94_012200 [Tulasnella sp. JGI-2019a]|nr:hypothetical protein FRB94_012200 [Tulasnella sp. JGI-2019a]